MRWSSRRGTATAREGAASPATMGGARPDGGAEAPPPPSVAAIVSKLQFTHMMFKGGKAVGIAFGDARPSSAGGPTMTLLLRTDDNRAWGCTEPLDMATEPLDQAAALHRRCERGEVGQGLLPGLHALRQLTRPFGDPAQAAPQNSAHAMNVALDVLKRAGHPHPEGIEWYAEAQRESHARTADLVAADAAFRATLDPAALALVESRRSRLGNLAVPGAWEALDATFQPDAPLRALMEPRPGLARTLTMAWAETPARLESAREAGTIDAFLASRSRLPRRLWPAVAGAVEASGDMPDGEVPGARKDGDPVLAWVGKLAAMPGDWIPTDAAEWTAYLRCQPAIDWALERTSDPEELSALLDHAGGWDAFEGDLSDATDGSDLRESLDVIPEMVEAFSRQVVIPALAVAGLFPDVDRWHATTAASTALTSGKPLAGILAEAALWQGRRDGIDAAIATLPHGAGSTSSWKAGFPDATYDGHEVVVLRDRLSLVEEGRDGRNPDGSEGLAHSLAARAADCAQGRARLLSIRTVLPDGTRERLSTVEVRWEREGSRNLYSVAAHAGPDRRPPGREAVQVLDRYVDDLRHGRLAPLDRFAFVSLGLREVDAAGYDVHAPGQWEAARDLWADFLPEAAMAMDATAFANALVSPFDDVDGPAWAPSWRPEPLGSPSWPVAAPEDPRP